MEADLGQLNIGLASAWRKAASREDWRRIVDTATLQLQYAVKEKKNWHNICKVLVLIGCCSMAGSSLLLIIVSEYFNVAYY